MASERMAIDLFYIRLKRVSPKLACYIRITKGSDYWGTSLDFHWLALLG